MERMQTTEREIERDDLTLDEFEGLEVIELPERELMCGCGGTGIFAGVAVAASVNLGCTNVNLAAGAAVY